MWYPKDERTGEQEGSKNAGTEKIKTKTDPYHSPPVPVQIITLAEFLSPLGEYGLSLLLPCIRKKLFALLFFHPVYITHPISK